ncbi:CehA/McbA family metallohydrolase [candidate division KSB1 bacterium]|nr:CehA/McbA family metallohydrolase [candidate division KSB1 bacterium]
MRRHLKYSNPYSRVGHWYKGNLHTHCAEYSNFSTIPLKNLVHFYQQHKYDFLAITDHDHLTEIPESLQAIPILFLPGYESCKTKHFQVIGISELIQLDQPSTITQARAQQALVIINHPNWQQPPHWRIEELLELDQYDGIEIFNSLIDRLVGWSHATDIWDQLLSQGKRCWGFAADDAHEPFDLGRADLMARAQNCDFETLMPALKRGDFYASTGAMVQEIILIENKIRLETDTETAFRFVGPNGKIVKTILGEVAEYWIEGWEDYVRVEGWNDHGWFWTQPFWGE